MRGGISHENLLTCLEQLEPVELEAVKLLRDFKATGVRPESTQAVTALRQLSDYEKICYEVRQNFSRLHPIPSNDEAFIWAFPL